MRVEVTRERKLKSGKWKQYKAQRVVAISRAAAARKVAARYGFPADKKFHTEADAGETVTDRFRVLRPGYDLSPLVFCFAEPPGLEGGTR